MAAWEVITSAFIALIFTFIFVGFQISEEKKYLPFKLFFLWFGFTLVIPFLGALYFIANEHLASVANLFKGVIIVYLGLYTLFVYILFVNFFKDVLQFFKKSINGFKGSDDEDEFH